MDESSSDVSIMKPILFCLLFLVLAEGSCILEELPHDDCPTWTHPAANGTDATNRTECECGLQLSGVVQCDDDKVKVGRCFCMTFSKQCNRTVLGACMISCHLTNTDLYYSVPQTLSNLNNATCGIYNRSGQMCSKCIPHHGVSVYSYGSYCVECKEYRNNWAYYLLMAYLPITLLYMVTLCFRFNITRSSLYSYMLVSQLLTTRHMASFLDLRIIRAPNTALPYKIGFAVHGIWNLDFGRSLYKPFCLHPSLYTHQVIALDYLIALYPLLLILLTYLLVKLHHTYRLAVLISKPLYWCVRRFQKEWNIKASLIDVFATFILLSNVKLLNVSFDLISVPVPLWDQYSNIMKPSYTLFNGTMEYLGKEHLPYFALGVTVILVFNVFPILLLCLYPFRCFQRCLNCCSLSRPSLHIFMDAFQGPYKATPHDYRHMAALPFIMVLLNFITFSLTQTFAYFTLFGLQLHALSFTLVVWRPYRSAKYNYFHALVYFILSFYFFTFNIPKVQKNHASTKLQLWAYLLSRMKTILVFSLTLLVLLYGAYQIFMAVKKYFKKKLEHSTKLQNRITSENTMEQDPLLENASFSSS